MSFSFKPAYLGVLICLFLAGCGLKATGLARPVANNLVDEVWQIINQDYVDGTFNHQDWDNIHTIYVEQTKKDPKAVYTSVQDMLALLQDPYTRFLNPRQYNELQSTVSGELSGVGLQIALAEKTNELTVIAPIEGSPAFRAGLRPRDVIIAINQQVTKGLDLDQAAQKLRGLPGTKVNLTIRRETQKFSLMLTRATVEINPVRYEIKTLGNTKLGYIRLTSFNSNATPEVKKAVLALESKQVKGYILDLRLNPGGLFAAGIEVARLWLPAGQTIVSTVTRQGTREVSRADRGQLTRKPLVVLVDQGTASSAEILAGSLQDNHRAQLVGMQTFGKGLIQQVYNLSDGSGLTVSIAKYQTPAGRDIHKIGIQPDVQIELPDAIRPQDIATPSDPQFATAGKLLVQSIASK